MKTGLLSDNSIVFCNFQSQIWDQLVICSPGPRFPIAQNNLPCYLGGFWTNYFTFRNADIFKNDLLQRSIIFWKKRGIFRNILRILNFRNAIIKNNKLFGTHCAEAASVLPSCKFWFFECSIASKRFSSNYWVW